MKIEMNEKTCDNLLVFLNRTDLKGAEVPAFVEIINAINTAKLGRIVSESNTDCKKVV
jgi:hypothetical protein